MNERQRRYLDAAEQWMEIASLHLFNGDLQRAQVAVAIGATFAHMAQANSLVLPGVRSN